MTISQTPAHPRSRSLRLLSNLLVCLALSAAPALLAAPALPGLVAPEPSPAAASTPHSPAEIQQALELQSAELARIEASPGYALNAPEGTPDDEIKQRRYYLRESIRSAERTLKTQARSATLSTQIEENKRLATAWNGFDTAPPYSILMLDALAQDGARIKAKLKRIKDRRDVLLELREQLMRSIRNNASELRQDEERSQRKKTALSAKTNWQLELGRLRLRAQQAWIEASNAAEQTFALEQAAAEIEAELAERKLTQAQAQPPAFSAAELELIDARLDTEVSEITRTLNHTLDAAATSIKAQNSAQHALNKALNEPRDSKHAPTQQQLESLQQAAQSAQTRSNNYDALLGSWRLLPSIIEIKRIAWHYRYKLVNEKTPALIAEGSEQYKVLAHSLDMLGKNFDGGLIFGDTDELGAPLSAATQKPEQPIYNEQLSRAIAIEASAREVVNSLGNELGARRSAQTLSDRALTQSARIKQGLINFWRFELFSVEQSLEINGQTVAGSSSITIGKILRAIGLFAGGILFTLWVGRAIEKFVVRHLAYDAARAQILRRWATVLGAILLMALVLTWVNIPLSVFAFLGGAIAIGVGFGMQNVLKNLISGLMLLFERPFNPGDLIEVGTVKGSVVMVGIRSSIIRDVNGIDTLVPNSTFVEQNVTNWMYENVRVRFGIKVGVAYGSAPKDVAVLLQESAARHGLILSEPAPEVLFENFGADSLEFGLYYWLDIGPKVIARQVASDLRFMISKSFEEHKINIAYPQRDVHLDIVQPVKVELTQSMELKPD